MIPLRKSVFPCLDKNQLTVCNQIWKKHKKLPSKSLKESWNFDWYRKKKMKFSIKDFFSKCDQIHSFLRIWSHLPKKPLMKSLCSLIV